LDGKRAGFDLNQLQMIRLRGLNGHKFLFVVPATRALIAIPNSRDRHDCCLSLADDLGDELFVISSPGGS